MGISHITPLGQSATATFTNRDGVSENVTITVLEVIRGDEAFAFIQEKNEGSYWQPQLPSDETDEYLVAKISFTLNSYSGGNAKDPENFNAAQSDGTRYPLLLASMFYNNDDFVQLSSQDIEVGQTVTAYEIFLIKKDDPTPVTNYRNFLADYSDGLWFALYK